MDWIVQDWLSNWLWNYLAEMEGWWSQQEQLWLRWKVHVLFAEGNVLVLEGLSIFVGLESGNLGLTETHDDDLWLRSQTLLIIASIPPALLDSVVKATEVHDLEHLLWFLFLEQLAEQIWEALVSPMGAISQIWLVEE